MSGLGEGLGDELVPEWDEVAGLGEGGGGGYFGFVVSGRVAVVGEDEA